MSYTKNNIKNNTLKQVNNAFNKSIACIATIMEMTIHKGKINLMPVILMPAKFVVNLTENVNNI